jgi:protein-disulfide isomerase
MTAFARCVGQRTYKASIEEDLKDGEEYGVSGTPAFFINGRLISGAAPYDDFKRVIDEELARAVRR